MISQRSISKIIWIHVLLIIGMGLTALYSASFNNNRVGQDVFYDQFFCALVGLGIMLFLNHFDYRKFFDFAYFIDDISSDDDQPTI